MKINKSEYEKMSIQFTLKRYKFLSLFIATFGAFAGFLISSIDDGDIIFNLVIGIIMAIVFYFVIRNSFIKSAKKFVAYNRVESVEQEIHEDKVVQKIIKNDKTESKCEMYYKDLIKVEEDKYNIYMLLSKTQGIMINKSKIENIEKFRRLVKVKEK